MLCIIQRKRYGREQHAWPIRRWYPNMPLEAGENMKNSTRIFSCMAEINFKWDMHQMYRSIEPYSYINLLDTESKRVRFSSYFHDFNKYDNLLSIRFSCFFHTAMAAVNMAIHFDLFI
jgi:hypothetical protein